MLFLANVCICCLYTMTAVFEFLCWIRKTDKQISKQQHQPMYSRNRAPVVCMYVCGGMRCECVLIGLYVIPFKQTDSETTKSLECMCRKSKKLARMWTNCMCACIVSGNGVCIKIHIKLKLTYNISFHSPKNIHKQSVCSFSLQT